MGVCKETMSYLSALVDGHKTFQDAIIAESDTPFDDHVGADRWAAAELGAGGNHRGRMNAGRRLFNCREKLQGMGEGEVGIPGAKEGPIRKVLLGTNDDSRGPRLESLPMILGVGEKGEFGFRSVFQPGHSGDF